MDFLTSNAWWLGPVVVGLVYGIVRLTKTKKDDELLDSVSDIIPDSWKPDEEKQKD